MFFWVIKLNHHTVWPNWIGNGFCSNNQVQLWSIHNCMLQECDHKQRYKTVIWVVTKCACFFIMTILCIELCIQNFVHVLPLSCTPRNLTMCLKKSRTKLGSALAWTKIYGWRGKRIKLKWYAKWIYDHPSPAPGCFWV